VGLAPRVLFVFLLTAAPCAAVDVAPAHQRFAERFLRLLRDPSPERFSAAASLPKLRERAKDFLKRFAPGDRRGDADLVDEWLLTLEPLARETWIGAAVVKSLSTRDGVERVRLRLSADDGFQVDVLVWLADDSGEKRFIDFQRLPSGMSAAAVAQFALVEGWGETLAEECRSMEEDVDADPRATLHRVKELSTGDLQQYRDRVGLVWASDAERPKGTLRYSKSLNRAFNDDPAVPWCTAKAHYELEQFRDVVRCLEWYESLVGVDAWSRLLRAKIHRDEGRFSDARRELAVALAENPNSIEAVLELFESTPPSSKADAAKLLPTDFRFDRLAWSVGATLFERGDAEGLEALERHAETAHAHADLVACLRGQRLLIQDKPAEAAAATAPFLPDRDEEDDEADHVLDVYCAAMHRLKKGEEAYRRSATPNKTLFSLLGLMVDRGDVELGERLGREHLRRFAQDGAVVGAVAQFLLESGRLNDAARTLDAFLARPELKGAPEIDALRRLRAKVFIAEKDLSDLLRFVGEDEELFEEAATLLADAGRVSDLEILVEGFKAPRGDPIRFLNWKAELAFLQKNDSLAFAYFQALAEPPNVALDDRRRVVFLRTMMRMGFKSGFEQAAEKLLVPGDELGFALAYAYSGNVAKLEIALEDCLEAGLTEQRITRDPDLGPLLAAPPLAKIRDKVLLDRDLAP
jgi:tetratricopeptide (TPR) repeat protein